MLFRINSKFNCNLLVFLVFWFCFLCRILVIRQFLRKGHVYACVCVRARVCTWINVRNRGMWLNALSVWVWLWMSVNIYVCICLWMRWTQMNMHVCMRVYFICMYVCTLHTDVNVYVEFCKCFCISQIV